MRDYKSEFVPISEARTLTPAYVEVCGERLCLVDEQAFYDFIQDAEANTEALGHSNTAYREKHLELLNVLASGQQAELQAQICHEHSGGISSAIRSATWPAAGVASFLLLLVAL